MSDEYDVVIVGGGPAAFTAAIYSGRAGMKTVVLDDGIGGGLMALSPLIENYPGFGEIGGMDLAQKMKDQAGRYSEIIEGTRVDRVEAFDRRFAVRSGERLWHSKALILATGADHKKLGVPGESELFGRGVSYCATCDGFFFRDRDVAVIGGGDSALTEGRYLISIGSRVTLVHRRGELRGEKVLRDAFVAEGGKVLFDTVVERFEGGEGLERVVLKNVTTDKTEARNFAGAFVAIGYEPKNVLAMQLDLELDSGGYIIVDRQQRTSLRGVYAAGDITGGLKQIATAVGEGAVAGQTVYEELANPYWKSP